MNLTWDITNRCNLSCKHCSNSYLMNETNSIEKKSWKKVIEYTDDFVDSVTLLGGEPLLHPEINSILKTLTEKNKSINTITNGQFDNSTWDEIMKYNISSIQISIDGMKESHDIIRGPGTWDKAMHSLKYLCEINKKINNRTKLGVSIVINNLNKDNIINFIESTKELNISYNLSSIYIQGNAKNNEDILKICDDDLLSFYENISLYYSQNANLEINLELFPLVADYLNRKYGTKYNIRNIECKALTDQVYADPHGFVQPCRKYNKVKINCLDSNSSWENDYNLFKPFIQKVHNVQNNYCDECIYKSSCVICPFESQTTTPSICTKSLPKLKALPVPLQSRFKMKKPYLILKEDNIYKIFFPNNHLISDYEETGGKILEYIQDFKTLEDISNAVSVDPRIVYSFLLQEKYSNKVIEQRNFQ